MGYRPQPWCAVVSRLWARGARAGMHRGRSGANRGKKAESTRAGATCERATPARGEAWGCCGARESGEMRGQRERERCDECGAPRGPAAKRQAGETDASGRGPSMREAGWQAGGPPKRGRRRAREREAPGGPAGQRPGDPSSAARPGLAAGFAPSSTPWPSTRRGGGPASASQHHGTAGRVRGGRGEWFGGLARWGSATPCTVRGGKGNRGCRMRDAQCRQK